MKRKVMLSFILVNIALLLFAQVGPRYTESQGGYSICPPASWEIMSFPGQPNKMFVEPAYDGYPAMMTFVSGSGWTKTVDQKFQEHLPLLKNNIPGYASVSTSDFTTAKGLRGKKHIYTFDAEGYPMRGVLYGFVSPTGSSVNITCGALSEYGTKFDRIFDESAATLEFTR